MIIISGIHRGRRLLAPPPFVRPIPVLLRKSLFDILGNRIRGCAFLDGYAGSGIVGMEAISRGAAHVDFVESDKHVAAAIERNLDRLAASEQSCVHVVHYENFLACGSRLYDFIFIDPPYEQGTPDEAVQKTFSCSRLSHDGQLIAKAPASWSRPQEHPRLTRSKIQGRNGLFFFSDA